jgi:hypothetical protein
MQKKQTTHVLHNMVFSLLATNADLVADLYMGESTLHRALFEFFLGRTLYIYLPKMVHLIGV